jgi:hypothetical protein
LNLEIMSCQIVEFVTLITGALLRFYWRPCPPDCIRSTDGENLLALFTDGGYLYAWVARGRGV